MSRAGLVPGRMSRQASSRVIVAIVALSLAAATGGCRNERESLGEEVAELERKQAELRDRLGPGASAAQRQEAVKELREEHREVADAVEELHEGREENAPIAGADVVRGTVAAVTPEGIRLAPRAGGPALSLALPAGAQLQAANGHELGREYVVPGAEVRVVYHGADTGAPQVDELWIDVVPGQERLPTQAPLSPAAPTPRADEDRSPPALPSGDPGGRVR